MRLLHHVSNTRFALKTFPDNELPFYGILSHTWGADDEELTFKDVTERQGAWGPSLMLGAQKLGFCHDCIEKDGLKYFWIDTCCIDKSSSAELQESLNSMFRWYKGAARCYVYLWDVSVENSVEEEEEIWIKDFRNSRWFKRGWTLQELIAPSSVEFYSKEGKRLGDKKSLEGVLHEITGIPRKALQGLELSRFSMEARMGWAVKRQTKRPEDAAYCLQGICNVYLPYMYGWGGPMAMRQLEKEIKESVESKNLADFAIRIGSIPRRYLIELSDAKLSSLDAGLDDLVEWFLEQRQPPKGKEGIAKTSREANIKMSELLRSVGIPYDTMQETKKFLNERGNQWEYFNARGNSDKERLRGWIGNRWLVANGNENGLTGYNAARTLYFLMIWRGKW